MQYYKELAAAERIGVRPRTLQRWRSLGTGPAYTRIGPRLIAYREVDLDAWAAARVYASNADELSRAAA